VYTCPTCSGSGTVGLAKTTCPQCFGRKEVVEDSQGLTVAWGTIKLGRLVGVSSRSPTVEMEDVTSMLAVVKPYTDATGATTNYGVVRYFIAGDITPGTVDIRWQGSNELAWGMVGHTKTLTISHPHNALQGSAAATLLSYSIDAQMGAIIEGTATFQFEGV